MAITFLFVMVFRQLENRYLRHLEPVPLSPGPVDAPRPAVRLRPNVAAQPLRWGAPWVYADQLVLDRRTRAIPAGGAGRAAGRRAAAARRSRPSTPARRSPRGCSTPIPPPRSGADWFAARLGRALALRETLFDAPFYRLVHAEADGLPGVVIDRFGDAGGDPAERRLGRRAARRAGRGPARGDGRRDGGQERLRAGAGARGARRGERGAVRRARRGRSPCR